MSITIRSPRISKLSFMRRLLLQRKMHATLSWESDMGAWIFFERDTRSMLSKDLLVLKIPAAYLLKTASRRWTTP
jgi:hypothetical protein